MNFSVSIGLENGVVYYSPKCMILLEFFMQFLDGNKVTTIINSQQIYKAWTQTDTHFNKSRGKKIAKEVQNALCDVLVSKYLSELFFWALLIGKSHVI